MTIEDLHVIRILLIIILFWVGVWGLSDELIHSIRKKYNIESWKLYLFVVLLMSSIILRDPHIFDKLTAI
jgi:hypothetical protein